jgi:hypothetical protein
MTWASASADEALSLDFLLILLALGVAGWNVEGLGIALSWSSAH